jgi:integrator complex subunit 11
VTKVDEQLEIKAYYAGHVLGAAMFQIRVGSQSIVYTGDYNMTPDRHLVRQIEEFCSEPFIFSAQFRIFYTRVSKLCSCCESV